MLNWRSAFFIVYLFVDQDELEINTTYEKDDMEGCAYD